MQIIDSAIALHRSHPHAPARDVLALVLEAHAPGTIDFGDVMPESEFGQLITAAFDDCMTVEEWTGLLKQVDASQRDALRRVWSTHVWPRFLAHFGLNGMVLASMRQVRWPMTL